MRDIAIDLEKVRTDLEQLRMQIQNARRTMDSAGQLVGRVARDRADHEDARRF